jgi:DHA3 family macrolide efflux protein-like MFS transporter
LLNTELTSDGTRTTSRLWNRNFTLLWSGQFVSQIGNQCFLVVTMFWTKEMTGSATIMGILTMLSSLPGLIVGPFAGTLADRHSRRAIVIGSDLVRCVILLAFTALLLHPGASKELLVSVLFAVATLNGFVTTLFFPAIQSLIPDLVSRDRVGAANSLNQLSARSAMSVGQAAGGVLYRLLGAPMLCLIDSATFLFSAAAASIIKMPPLPQRESKEGLRHIFASYLGDTRAGLRYVWDRPGMRSFLASTASLNFFFMPLFVLLPFYVQDVLRSNVDAYGFLMGAFAAGSLSGSALTGVLHVTGKRRWHVISSALFATSTLFGILGLVRTLIPALACFFAIGVLTALINVFAITQFQMATPREMRGRVLSLVLTTSRAVAPIGMGLGGILGDAMRDSIPLIYVLCGVAALLITLLTSMGAGIRSFLSADLEITE